MVVVTQLDVFVEIHRTVRLKAYILPIFKKRKREFLSHIMKSLGIN